MQAVTKLCNLLADVTCVSCGTLLHHVTRVEYRLRQPASTLAQLACKSGLRRHNRLAGTAVMTCWSKPNLKPFPKLATFYHSYTTLMPWCPEQRKLVTSARTIMQVAFTSPQSTLKLRPCNCRDPLRSSLHAKHRPPRCRITASAEASAADRLAEVRHDRVDFCAHARSCEQQKVGLCRLQTP